MDAKKERTGKRITVAAIAAAAGVSRASASLWLNNPGPEGPKRAAIEKLAAFLEVTPAWLEHGEYPLKGVAQNPKIPEQTPKSLAAPLQLAAARYEVEALEAGADEDDMRYIRLALRSPEAVEMYHGGYMEPMSSNDQRVEMESVIAMLRLWLAERIKRRPRPAGGANADE